MYYVELYKIVNIWPLWPTKMAILYFSTYQMPLLPFYSHFKDEELRFQEQGLERGSLKTSHGQELETKNQVSDN